METPNRFNPAELQSWGIATLRITVGVILLVHGLQKLIAFGIPGTAGFFAHAGLPLPMLSAVLSIGAETLGGLALVLGLFTRPAAAVLTFNMFIAVVAVHLKNGFFAPTGFEYPFSLMMANAALVLAGTGAFALDNLVQRTHGAFRNGPHLLRSEAKYSHSDLKV
jgi:putative oxidoreductase